LIGAATRKTIQSSEYNDIPRPDRKKQALQQWPMIVRSAHFLSEYSSTTSRAKLQLLNVQYLAMSTHPCISEDRHQETPNICALARANVLIFCKAEIPQLLQVVDLKNYRFLSVG
jgi:hypothetical protein